MRNRWTYGYGLVTLTRRPTDLPGIHCYGSGTTKKEAVRAWVADWHEAQAMHARITAMDARQYEPERLAA